MVDVSLEHVLGPIRRLEPVFIKSLLNVETRERRSNQIMIGILTRAGEKEQ